MKIIYFLYILIACSSLKAFAQPEWATKVPQGYLNDYFVGSGSSYKTKTEAIQLAIENAIFSIVRNGIITISYKEGDNIISKQKILNNNTQQEIIRQSAQELRLNGESKTIKNLKEVETYFEENSTRKENSTRVEAWVLLSLPKKHPISPPSAFSPVWRSFLLPGWGQLYKEQTFKGISFMVFALGGVAGGVVFRQLNLDASNKAFSSRTQSRRDFYNNEARDYNTYSTLSFISAGIFYAWSLVDAIIVNQDNLYVRLELNGDESRMVACFSF